MVDENKTGSNLVSSYSFKGWLIFWFFFSAFPITIFLLGYSLIVSQQSHSLTEKLLVEFRQQFNSIKSSQFSQIELDKFVAEFNEKNPQFFLGRLNLSSPEQSFPFKDKIPGIGLRIDSLVETQLKMRNNCREYVIQDGLLIAMSALDLKNSLFAVSPVKKYDPSTIGLMVLCSFAIFILAGFLGYVLIFKARDVFVSIRAKLVGLFLYATFFPGLAFYLLGFQFLSDRELVLREELFSEMENFINSLEDNQNLSLMTNCAIYDKFLQHESIKTGNYSDIGKTVAELRKSNILNGLYIFSLDGDAKLFDDRATFPNFLRKVIATSLFNRLSHAYPDSAGLARPENIDSSEFVPDAPVLMTDNWIILDFHGLFIRMFMFTKIITDASGEKKVIAITHSIDSLSNRFLHKQFERLSSEDTTTGFVSGVIRINNKEKAVVYGNKNFPGTSELIDSLDLKTRQEKNQIRFFLTGNLGVVKTFRWKKDYQLFVLASTRGIDETISGLTNKIAGISILSGIFAFFVGWLLARQFLWPVKELAVGISAIEKMDFSYRVPDLNRDELGNLGQHYNRIMPELEEMHVGKAVQEALLPAGNLKIGDYEILGSSKAMTQMMGDYFDYFEVDHTHLVTIVGDAAGHGVPAGLLMAIAKGGVGMLSAEEFKKAELAMVRLNEVLRACSQKRMMTLQILAINKETHDAYFVNAGHTYPFFYNSAENKLEQISLASFPLGITKKIKPASLNLKFNPGDMMVFYSDGIVEALNDEQQQLGYQKLEKIVYDALKKSQSHSQIIEQIYSAYQKFLGSQSPQDDTTIVVICRSKA